MSGGQLRTPDLGFVESFYKETSLATPVYKGEAQKGSPINLDFVNTTLTHVKPAPDVFVLVSQPWFNIDQVVYVHITSTLRP